MKEATRGRFPLCSLSTKMTGGAGGECAADLLFVCKGTRVFRLVGTCGSVRVWALLSRALRPPSSCIVTSACVCNMQLPDTM